METTLAFALLGKFPKLNAIKIVSLLKILYLENVENKVFNLNLITFFSFCYISFRLKEKTLSLSLLLSVNSNSCRLQSLNLFLFVCEIGICFQVIIHCEEMSIKSIWHQSYAMRTIYLKSKQQQQQTNSFFFLFIAPSKCTLKTEKQEYVAYKNRPNTGKK